MHGMLPAPASSGTSRCHVLSHSCFITTAGHSRPQQADNPKCRRPALSVSSGISTQYTNHPRLAIAASYLRVVITNTLNSRQHSAVKMWPFSGSSVAFSAKDIPSLQGKVIVVTGGNSGLGKQSVLDLARHKPQAIWLTARTIEKADQAIADIKQDVPDANIKPLVLDLTSLDSVKAAARAFTTAADRLDILMLNAGCMAAPEALTKDGYELQFGTNHVGHALFTRLLTPILDRTAAEPNADVRVVVLSSAAVAGAPSGGIQFDTLKTTQGSLNTWARYGQSKLANALYARELARKHPNWTVTAIHPGVINTNLTHYVTAGSWWVGPVLSLVGWMLTTIEDGVLNQLWAATAPKDQIKSGTLYYPVGRATGGQRGPYTEDDALANKLWQWTEEELKNHTI